MEPSARSASALLALALSLVALSLGPARAQSVGEAARQEKERRAKTTKPAKVYTDADLAAKHSRPEDEATAASSETAKTTTQPSTSATKPAEDETAERKRLEADWRIRFADARRKIALAEQRCWHSVVRTVFMGSIPVQQWVKEFEESDELRQAKLALALLEEEFRKTGLPPGWTRE